MKHSLPDYEDSDDPRWVTITGRFLVGILALIGIIKTTYWMAMGEMPGRHFVFWIERKSDPVQFWLMAGAMYLLLGFLGYGALRGFNQRRKPIQPPQRNAGSRPPSGDSPASENPSSPGPRG